MLQKCTSVIAFVHAEDLRKIEDDVVHVLGPGHAEKRKDATIIITHMIPL
jgi:hypothetical protein